MSTTSTHISKTFRTGRRRPWARSSSSWTSTTEPRAESSTNWCAIIPGAVFVGFTGTPLLVKDKATSLEVFGRYIHTYKFNEAVEDHVVLDLVYEAQDIDQRLRSQVKID